MHTTRRWLAGAVWTAILTGCGGAGSRREPQKVVLTPPTDTLTTPYTDVTRAAWLGGGRWAVLALSNETVGIVDFDADTLLPLDGGQSGELRNPSMIFAALDTLYVGDWGLRRTTLWTTGGELVRDVSSADMIGGALPEARDAAGRFYVELLSPGGAGARDSAAVVRTGPRANGGDTVARLTPLDVKEMLGEQGRRFERRIFSGEDHWGALPDGSVWVARVNHNRVDRRSPDGAWSRGRSLPDRVLEVTRYDREMFIRKFPPELQSMARQLPFAPIKPPFDDAFSDPDGNVWLTKSRMPMDSVGQYHVVDSDGWLRRDISVPGDGRVIGVARDMVLVAVPSPTGTRLLRFALPPLAAEPADAN